MAPDDNNPGGWKVPKGYTLTRIPGHYVNARGMAVEGAVRDRGPMTDGQIEVPHFSESAPFVWEENDGRGPNASVEARKAALAGDPIAGWNPNCIMLPIEGSWVPDQYTLSHDDDDTPVTEPATPLAVELTPEQEVARLEASIKATQARIAEIKGGAS